MVASLALPASAAPLTPTATLTTGAMTAIPVTVPSVAKGPLAPRAFGLIGFTGVHKPKPVPAPVVERTVERVSRSTTRTPISAPKPEAPAPAPAPAPAQAPSSGGVLDIAATLNGIDYVYGGTTPAGFDCSGFTQYIFNKVGISLPRTAEAQRQFATTVTNPQPGDLVFFGAPAHHMGIYAGNGMMWDSPRTGKAVSLRAVYSPSVTYGRV